MIGSMLTLAVDSGLAMGGAAIGAGLAIIGAGIGIGRAADASCDATARQPEAGGRIFTNMIIAAALIEGATLFGLVTTFLIFQAASST